MAASPLRELANIVGYSLGTGVILATLGGLPSDGRPVINRCRNGPGDYVQQDVPMTDAPVAAPVAQQPVAPVADRRRSKKGRPRSRRHNKAEPPPVGRAAVAPIHKGRSVTRPSRIDHGETTEWQEFPVIAHVALTVTDLDRSRRWYNELFGSDPILDEDTGPFHHVVWHMGGTLVAINEFPELAPAL